MILIIDHGLGNFLSVRKAFEAVAEDTPVVVLHNPDLLEEATHVVLSGVGTTKVAGIQRF